MPQDEMMRMKKLIFRTTRGKAYAQFFPLEEKIYDYYGNQLDTMIYFVFCPHEAKFMRDRLRKICDSFHGETYELPRVKDEINE